MDLVFLAANLSAKRATAPNSVVQTGVKSLGWGEILGVREQNRIAITNPVVKFYCAFGRLCGEVRGGVIDA